MPGISIQGLPEVRKYLVDLYETLVKKYDFDGLSLDYTRYPGKDFNDAASFAKYGNGMKIEDWRRENINTFVGELYDMIKLNKPNMKLGSAPIVHIKIIAIHTICQHIPMFFRMLANGQKEGNRIF